MHAAARREDEPVSPASLRVPRTAVCAFREWYLEPQIGFCAIGPVG
jgi:hypothetical protein